MTSLRLKLVKRDEDFHIKLFNLIINKLIMIAKENNEEDIKFMTYIQLINKAISSCMVAGLDLFKNSVISHKKLVKNIRKKNLDYFSDIKNLTGFAGENGNQKILIFFHEFWKKENDIRKKIKFMEKIEKLIDITISYINRFED